MIKVAEYGSLAVERDFFGGFVTTEEAAQRLGVSRGRVRQFVVEGRLQGVLRGRMLWFRQEEVERFANKPRPPGKVSREERKKYL